MAQADTSLNWMHDTAVRTVSGFPPAFKEAAEKIALRVVDWPDKAMLAEVGLQHAHELTGLYEGIPLTQKSFFDQPLAPDTVWLFRQPILREWRERGNVDLAHLVAHVTVHEFAHHFGWSDEDIARIDPWWE